MEMSQMPASLGIPAIGLGCWDMSNAYDPADKKESIATIEAALATSLRNFDTADVYGDGHKEIQPGWALAGRRQDVFLATKFGFVGDDYRRRMPRFAEENLPKNRALVETLEIMALAKNGTAAQVALAWLLAQGVDILPIPGMKQRSHLQDNLGALKIQLTPDDLALLSTLSESVQGQQYNSHNLKFIEDS